MDTLHLLHTSQEGSVHFVHFQDKLRRLMDFRRLTNKALGEALGISHTTVGRWLKGESVPQDRLLYRLSETLGVHRDILENDKIELTKGTDIAKLGGYDITPGLMEKVEESFEGAFERNEDIFGPKIKRLLERLRAIEKEIKEIRGDLNAFFD
jgi:transcriptional regulator with XRE-family HTH domain